MSGIPVVVVERFGLPVKAVEGRAPVMTVSPYGLGIPIVLSEWGAPFIVEGLVPPLNPPGPINDLSVLSTTTSTIALAFTDAARATSHEYQLNGGGWVPLDPSKVIDSLPPDTSFDVQVRGVNAEGNGPPSNTVQAQTQPVPIPAPVNTAVPTITGIAQVGEELTASTGTWTNSPIGYAYQWQRNTGSWADIPGATSNTYLLDEGDEGATIRVQVIASNAGGPSVPANSAATGTVQPEPGPTWQSFALTSGSNAFGWGYAIEPIVSAPFGAIDRQPYTGSTLLGFWEAPDDSRIIVVFAGDVVDELDGFTFEIDGVPLAVLTPASYNSGPDTTIMYLESHWMVDDQEYAIERVPAAPVADFIVTTDGEFATANANATAGQVIQLQDSGTFTDLILDNATGVTVRGQTPGVPTMLSFRCHGATNAYITGFKIKPTAVPSGAPVLLNLTNNGSNTCDGVVIDGIIIEGGNPWDSFAPFDPTVTDIDEMGTTGDWAATNAYQTDLWDGIGTDASVSGSIPGGDITIKNCVITDVGEAIKFTYNGNGGLRILNNTIARPYQDFIAIGLAHYSGPVTHLEICGNEGFDSFAQPQDNLNPHGDFIQFFSDDIPPDLYEMPIYGILIAGNVHWYNPGARGQAQRVFISEFVDGYPAVAPIVIDNLLISRITNKGVVIDAVDMDQSGSVWGYVARNTIAANPQHNAPMQNEVYTNSVSGIGASSGAAVASIQVRSDPLYPDAMNYIANNVTESIIADSSYILVGNVSLSRGSNATSYGSNANPSTPGAWDALASAEDYFDAFDAVAGKGVGLAGSTMAAIRAAWADPSSRPWSSVPSWVGWRNVIGAPLDTLTTSEWAFVHAGGPGGSRSLAITGGEYQLADDHTGAGAGSWTSSSGTVDHGKYMRVRLTSPNTELTDGTISLTIGSDVLTWNVQTESTAEYAIVAFDGSDRFVRPGILGSDSRYCTIGFKMKFPASNPDSNVDIFTSLNSAAGASSAGVRVILLTTGLLRIVHYNSAASSISTMNMTAGSLCDGNVHEVLIDVDLGDSNAATGRQIWVDGLDRTTVTSSAWGGGPGVTIAYSRSTGTVGYSFGGAAGNMINGFEVEYFYLNITERAGVDNSAIRSRFDASAIGADGSGVTGNQPHTFLTGVAAQWNAGAGFNWGYDGDYVAAAGSAVTDVSGDPWP